MSIFSTADILLPQGVSMEKWAVIACDQFASQPEYWLQAGNLVGDAPSTLNLIWPESQLDDDPEIRISAINAAMRRYLAEGLFQTFPNAFIYVERTLLSGQIRRGVVGAVDLAEYDYTPGTQAQVRATEKTVIERIPPRVNIRKDAPIELPHVLLLCDDPAQLILGSIQKDSLPVIYDFDLMQGGGHITGWLLQGQDAKALEAAIAAYEQQSGPVKYAVGDGNHSLAAAKACYELHKTTASRYALVELENIHDASQVFEPIHRIIKNTDPDALLAALPQCENGHTVRWFSGKKQGTVRLKLADGQLPVGALQNFLDDYLKNHPGETDYIHGDDSLKQLSADENAIGFLLPPMEKSSLFPGIIADGVLPRKTFSMGHAQEKRYYLEARIIQTQKGEPA